MGNRIVETVNGVQTQYVIDNNDRLSQQGGTRYQYDDNGNTINETLDGITTSYTYDSRNRLIATDKGGAQIDMEYDPDGIRVQKVVDGEATDYLVDSNRAYAQVLFEKTGASELGYTFGTDLVGLDTGSESYSYQTDALGSTRLLSDGNGVVADEVAFDAWGVQLGGGDVAENQYLFTGEQFDSELDKVYLRARYYTPEIGRLQRMDEWNGVKDVPNSLNHYIYVENEPSNSGDPSGYCATPLTQGNKAEEAIQKIYKSEHENDDVLTNKSFRKWIPVDVRALRPDIINRTKKRYAEIKPLSFTGISRGAAQMTTYVQLASQINKITKGDQRYYREKEWEPANTFVVCGYTTYARNVGGVIFYSNDDTVRTFVAEATTLAMLTTAVKSSRVGPRAFVTTRTAISLLNRAAGISGAAMAGGVRAMIGMSMTMSFSF